MIHKSIDKLPLSIFLDCLCDDNYRALVISGDHTDEEVAAAWQDIQEQYAEALGDSEMQNFLKLLKEVNIISITIGEIKLIVELMRQVYVAEFAEDLNKLLGVEFKWDPLDLKKYDELLNRCINRTKGMEIKMEIKNASLEEMKKKMSGGNSSKPSRSYYDKLLNLMEEHYSIQVDDTIYVSRFCDRLRRMINSKPVKKPAYGRR